MAGHSKWANIKHRKGKQDAIRGKIFTKLIRLITVAARLGGEDANSNSRLRDAIDKAKEANMSNDTIERAIKKGVGGLDGQNMEEITYEGYGPGGVAVLVSCLTDNRNRTVSEVRHAFSKCGGNLGTDGSVAYLFKKLGQLTFSKGADEEAILTIALEHGAEDLLENEDGSLTLTTTPDNFSAIKHHLEASGIKAEFAEISLVASNEVAITDIESAQKMMKLQDILEDLDDVQNVYSNATLDEDLLEKIQN
jgi:YebC/PmpR family DNA-binding regulatory protein